MRGELVPLAFLAVVVGLITFAAYLHGKPADPPAHRLYLGIDCNPGTDANGDRIAYAVSLPDDVLTECEGEPRHER
ncbi:MAG: hypothetical protein OXH37_01425 [Gammaproteobacteria bacterium]|nr:hypothetical protein [Gammaproteobacteria bacterium]